MTITPRGTLECLEKRGQQRLLWHAYSLGRMQGTSRWYLWCQHLSFFISRLAKASAVWDGGTERLLALANKDSEKRSMFFLFFLLFV